MSNVDNSGNKDPAEDICFEVHSAVLVDAVRQKIICDLKYIGIHCASETGDWDTFSNYAQVWDVLERRWWIPANVL